MSAPQRILIVRLGAMGDILHAMPAVAALRQALPDTRFGWVVEKRWADLLDTNIVDTVHLVDTRFWRRNLMKRSTFRGVFSAISSIRNQKYELAVDFQGAIKSAIVSAASGAPRRYGFAEPREKPATLFYSHSVRSTAAHVVEQNLELASSVVGRPLSVVSGARSCFVTVMDREFSQLLSSQPFVVMNPGAGWGAKQWPLERYAEVARALGADGFRSLINFGPGEEELVQAIEQSSKGYAFAKQLTVSQLRAVTLRASLFVGGDTGPLHLAAALKVPVVALFGPTDPARTGPYGTRSIVLRDPSSVTSHKRNRETEAGLKNIIAEQVIAAARELLKPGAQP